MATTPPRSAPSRSSTSRSFPAATSRALRSALRAARRGETNHGQSLRRHRRRLRNDRRVGGQGGDPARGPHTGARGGGGPPPPGGVRGGRGRGGGAPSAPPPGGTAGGRPTPPTRRRR